MVVLEKGQVNASTAWGWARRPSEASHPGVPFTTNTVIQLASTSKTITAVALLHLWDEKQHSFSLDDSLWEHLRSLVPEVSEEAKQITIRQVLQHTSGLPKEGSCNTYESLGALLRKPLSSPPGKTSHYDNRNYYIVRVLIEALSGQNYVEYVREHVLAPMDIHHTDCKPWGGVLPCGYASLRDRNPGIEFREDSTLVGGGAGGWYSNALDMGKFMAGLANYRPTPCPGWSAAGRPHRVPWLAGCCL